MYVCVSVYIFLIIIKAEAVIAAYYIQLWVRCRSPFTQRRKWPRYYNMLGDYTKPDAHRIYPEFPWHGNSDVCGKMLNDIEGV